MAKFTKTEDLFDYVNTTGQTIGPVNNGTMGSIYNGGTRNLGVFYPERGQNIKFRNPQDPDSNEPWADAGAGSSHIIEDYDGRESLGTITINERGDWPDVNYNPATLSPYLTGDKENVEVTVENGKNGELIYIPYHTIDPTSATYRFSIDALPFVLNSADEDEIIHVDRYYDRAINPIEYGLATEGKINFYIYPRKDGRTSWMTQPVDKPYKTLVPWMPRPLFTAGDPETGVGGTNRFNVYAKDGDNAGGPGGFYLFKLNWGDGSNLEYTTDPLLLEGSTLLEHYYEKPGFYKITGVVYASYKGEAVDSYELFETSIWLNPSKNYSIQMFDYDDFAMIGGVSRNSALSRTSANIMGIDPIKLSNSPDLFLADARSSPEVIEKLNLLDKIQLLNYLSKLEGSVLTKYDSLIEPYSGRQPRLDNENDIVSSVIETTPSDYQYEIGINNSSGRFDLIPTIDYGVIKFKIPDALIENEDDSVFTTNNPNPNQAWNIDWSTVTYEVELKYYDDGGSPYYDNYGQTEWMPLGEYVHNQVYDEDTEEFILNDEFEFSIGHPAPELNYQVNEPYNSLYIPHRTYMARMRINAQELQNHNGPLFVSSAWFEMGEEGVVALPGIEDTAKVYIDVNLNIAGEYQSGDGFPTLSPEYPSGFDNLFLNAANLEIPLQMSTADDWTFESFHLDGLVNNGAYLENDESERINSIKLSEGYSYDSNAEDVTMTLNVNYTYNGQGGGDPPPELATIDINLEHPQNPSGADTDDATYEWNSGGHHTQLTTNFDSDTAVISAPDRVVTMVSLIRQGGGSNEIGQDQNEAVVGGVRFTLNGGNLTAQNENEMEGSYETIDVATIMTQYDGGGDGGGNSCFLKGTMITMVDGKQLPIEDIQVGMEVMSFDEKTGDTTHNKVVEVFHHPKEETDAYLIINDNIKVTENHVMYVPNDRYTEEDDKGHMWLRADHIIVGDYLIGKSAVEVKSIEKVNESVTTYNFEVENTHTYFAESVVVHNAGGGPGGGSGKGRRRSTGGTETGADGGTGGGN